MSRPLREPQGAVLLVGLVAGWLCCPTAARADALSWNRLDVHVGVHSLEVEFDLAQERVVEAVTGAHPSAQRGLEWYEERRGTLLKRIDESLRLVGPRGACVGAEPGPFRFAPERHLGFTRRYECGATLDGTLPLSIESRLFRGPEYGFNVFGAVLFHGDRQLVAAFDDKHSVVKVGAADFFLPAGAEHSARVTTLVERERSEQREQRLRDAAEQRGNVLIAVLLALLLGGGVFERLRALRWGAAFRRRAVV